MLWIEEQVDGEKTDQLSRSLSISGLLAKLLVGRGIETPDDAKSFLEPKLAHLSDPFDLPGLEEASLRIALALEQAGLARWEAP